MHKTHKTVMVKFLINGELLEGNKMQQVAAELFSRTILTSEHGSHEYSFSAFEDNGHLCVMSHDHEVGHNDDIQFENPRVDMPMPTGN